MDGLETCLLGLRMAAGSLDPHRRVFIERHIDDYLKTAPHSLINALERLSKAIRYEEAEQREGEDWQMAKEYVRALQNMMAY
jgi:hypothetical protein